MTDKRLTPLQARTGTLFYFGQVWLVRDEDVHMPDASIGSGRMMHEFRPVVVVSNNGQNSNAYYPMVTIAPCSTRVDKKQKHDIQLFPGRDGVNEVCVIRVGLLQPCLKIDLCKYLGMVSEDKKTELSASIAFWFGGKEMRDLADSIIRNIETQRRVQP